MLNLVVAQLVFKVKISEKKTWLYFYTGENMNLKLYYSPNACSLSAHIALRECGLKHFDLIRVDLDHKKTEIGEDYYKINPNGYVPALVLKNGQILTEGPAIVQYIADLAPTSEMAPAQGTMARYQLQSWLNFICSELHKLLTVFFKSEIPEEYKKMALEVAHKRFNVLEQHLQTHSFLMGEKFTVADAYLFTILRWTKFVKISLTSWPILLKYLEVINERPAVQAALQAEELGK